MESTEELEERTLEECLAPSSLAMIAACFRHQHPEEFGREAISPAEPSYGQCEAVASSPFTSIPEETMGYPGARPLTEDPIPRGES